MKKNNLVYERKYNFSITNKIWILKSGNLKVKINDFIYYVKPDEDFNVETNFYENYNDSTDHGMALIHKVSTFSHNVYRRTSVINKC